MWALTHSYTHASTPSYKAHERRENYTITIYHSEYAKYFYEFKWKNKKNVGKKYKLQIIIIIIYS